MVKKIRLPEDAPLFGSLKAGDRVLLSGVVYTARDAAHRRLTEMMKKGEPLPFALAGQTIYYAGPCPAPAGKSSGSCGPTTSYRVDVFTPALLDAGLKGMIGKGERGEAVVKSIVRNRAIYFAAIGGLGATYGNAIRKSECIAFPDLLSEGVHRLEIEDFPVVVAIDADGGSIYGKRT